MLSFCDVKMTRVKITYKIPFNKPHLTNKEITYISSAHSFGQLSGDGYYTKECHKWLEKHFNTQKAFLTHSCTSALDMMAILTNIKPGDEIIMPSFNFTSSANAVVLRGGIPVFVDIRPDTLNINEELIEEAITPKTKAIFVVHYAGISCEMDTIKKIAKKYNLFVLEDAAQGFLSKYKNQYLGTIGEMGAYSFHETKNVISGEGGALLVNDPKFIERAEIIREKGTNRNKFFRGEVDKYTWVDIGSSYLPGEITAAFLIAQFEKAHQITKKRLAIWSKYFKHLEKLEKSGFITRPSVPKECQHNGHLFYILTKNLNIRDGLIKFLKNKGILSVFHYIPLHSSPAGKKYTRFVGSMSVTTNSSDTLIRLPLFYDITNKEIEYVIDCISKFFKK